MKPYYSDALVTIYHGDCREILPQVRNVDAILTDPPFKLSQEYSASTDSDNLLSVASIIEAAPLMRKSVRAGGVAVVFYDTRILPFALDSFRRGGWKYLRALTLYRRWGNAHQLAGWMSTSDFALVFGEPSARQTFYGPWAHDVYTRASAEAVSTGHPAQKPLAVIRHITGNICQPDGIVLDCWMGSGTTLRAAKDLGRRAIGIEIEERYCEIAAERCRQEVLDLGA